jgi:hypothetical protein
MNIKSFIRKVIQEGFDINEGYSEGSIIRKVNEINQLIAAAKDEDGDPIGVIDRSSTWQSECYYEPIIYAQGNLFITYKENTGRGMEVHKERITKPNMELDGIGTLNNIAKMYRYALKQHELSKTREDID